MQSDTDKSQQTKSNLKALYTTVSLSAELLATATEQRENSRKTKQVLTVQLYIQPEMYTKEHSTESWDTAKVKLHINQAVMYTMEIS